MSDPQDADKWYERARVIAEIVLDEYQHHGNTVIKSSLVQRTCWSNLPESGVWDMARICLGELFTEHLLSKIRIAETMSPPAQFDFSKYRAFCPSAVEKVQHVSSWRFLLIISRMTLAMIHDPVTPTVLPKIP